MPSPGGMLDILMLALYTWLFAGIEKVTIWLKSGAASPTTASVCPSWKLSASFAMERAGVAKSIRTMIPAAHLVKNRTYVYLSGFYK
jgi:hypothetical protein